MELEVGGCWSGFEHNTLEVQFIFICDKTKTEIQKNQSNSIKRCKGEDYQTLQNVSKRRKRNVKTLSK
jgi:hypothetical protein